MQTQPKLAIIALILSWNFFSSHVPVSSNAEIAEGLVIDGNCSGPSMQYLLRLEHSNKYLQAEGNGNIQQWTLNAGNNQSFFFRHISNGQYQIVNVQTNMVIGVAGNSTANGANIELQNSTQNTGQLFTIDAVGNGSYHIINVNSGQLLNVAGASNADGGNVLQWPNQTQTNDNFFLEPQNSGCDQMMCEIQVDGGWQTLADCNAQVSEGQNVMLSFAPNGVNIDWTLPDGTTQSTQNLNLGQVTTSDQGWYHGAMNINGTVIEKAIRLTVQPGPGSLGILTQYDVGGAVSGVLLHNDYLFVPIGADHGGGQGAGAFAFYDISDPTTVIPVFDSRNHNSTYHNSGQLNYVGDWAEIHSLPVIGDGNTFVISERRNGSAGFSIFDVSGFPSQQPQTVSRFSFPGVTNPSNYQGYSFSLATKGSDYVIAPTGSSGLYIVDIKNVNNPTLAKHMTLSQLGNQILVSAVVIGDLLILTNAQVGISSPVVFVDISDPTNPSIISTSQSIPIGYQAFVYGSEIFGATDGNIVGYDFTDPSNLSMTTYNTVAQNHLINPEYGFGQDDHLFIGHYPGLTKWDMNGSSTAPPVITAEPQNPSSDDYAFLTPIGNLAVVSSDHNHPNKVNIARHATGPDLTPPAIEYILPHDQSVNVDVDASIGIAFSDFIDPLSLNTQNFQLRKVSDGSVVSGSFSHMLGIVSFVPSSDLEDNTTYELTLVAGGVKDWRGNAMSNDVVATTFSTGNAIASNPPFTINTPTPTTTSQNAQFSINHSVNVTYEWDFGDGTPIFTTSTHTTSHVYSAVGNYVVTVTAIFPQGSPQTQTTVQAIHQPLLSNAPKNSSSIIYDGTNGNIWVANPDNNTVTAISDASNNVIFETAVGQRPEALCQVGNEIWVTNKLDATISVLNALTGGVVSTISLPRASRPHGIVYDQVADRVFVGLEATRILTALNPSTRQVINSVNLPGSLRHISMIPGSGQLYAAQFISPEDAGKVHVVDVNTFSLISSVNLAIDNTPDGQFNGSGLPNYIGAMAISPDGSQAFVPSKKDNIARGLFRNGQNLTFEHTVRSMAMSLDLSTNSENLSRRIDMDNSDFATATTFNAYGNYVFISTSGSSIIWVFDAYTGQSKGSFNSGGLAPRGLVMNGAGNRLYVHNFMERNVVIFDVGDCSGSCESAMLVAAVPTVGNEVLASNVLTGKRLFYDATDTRLTTDSYMSCASCHLDGTNDGRTWDMTGFGEGFRNTVDLRGRAALGHGVVHWTGNFDEIQDFENQIRTLNSGAGFLSSTDFANTQDPLGNPKAGLSSDLDALAAYVQSLVEVPESPHKNQDGSLTAAAVRGQAIFDNLKCYSCHGGAEYTASALVNNNLFDVGTIQASSGKRLDKTLRGFDVPTLKGVWASAPYLHDGSAATLMDVLTTKNPDGKHGNVASLSGQERDDLVAFLNQIDGTTPAANQASNSLAVTAPSQGQQIVLNSTNDFSVNITAENIQYVEYYIDDVLAATVNNAPYTASVVSDVAGDFAVFARAVFDGGKVMISEPVTYSVQDLSYCSTDATNQTYEYIQRVQLGSINNTSGNNGGYGDFTNLTTSFEENTSYSIELVPGFAGSSYNEHWTVWIDYNLNGSFSDPGEQVFQGAGTGTVNGTINVPAGINSSTTTMRINMQYNAYFGNPCGSFTYGEVEDYGIVLVASAMPSCSDGVQNGNETGVDCGGPDCSACPPSCTDGIQNGNETGVDCGGPDCPACPSCSDGIQNGNETGVDCGGPDCPACPSCSDGIQNGNETGVDCGGPDCPACPSCSDGIQNGNETGVDCGGPDCPACPSCSDGIQNGNETGVDCGGPDCPACPPSCSDGIQNGNETGVDCGGPDCPACATCSGPVVSILPYNESFENGLGDWAQGTDDDFNWIRRTGGTPSNNTGPSGASTGQYYMYMESSTPNYPSRTAIFNGPCFNLTNETVAQLDFSYHMYGSGNMGELKLEVSTDDGASWTAIWSRSGNQGNSWRAASVSLNSYVGSSVKLRFNGTTGSTWQGDMAIDDLEVYIPQAGNCENTVTVFPYSESFEGSFGLWEQGTVDDIDWTLRSGGTPSSGTGPSGAQNGSQYVYVEASNPNYPNKRAVLTSPCIDLAGVTNPELNFYYHMLGNSVGDLKLEVSIDGALSWTSIWSLSGSQGSGWNSATVDLSLYAGQVILLRFDGETGGSWQGDICIDNINLAGASTFNLAVSRSTKRASAEKARVRPNPFMDQVQIDSERGVRNVHIFSLTGELKYSAKRVVTDDALTVNLDHLSSGAYVMVLEFVDGHSQIEKLIKL